MYGLEGLSLPLDEGIELLGGTGEHPAQGNANKMLFELSRRGNLRTSEGILDRCCVVGKRDPEVVSGLVGKFALLVVQGLGGAGGDKLQRAALLHCLGSHLFVVQLLVVMMVAVLKLLNSLVVLLKI